MGVGREQLQDCILNPFSQLPLKHCQEGFQIFADLVDPGGKEDHRESERRRRGRDGDSSRWIGVA